MTFGLGKVWAAKFTNPADLIGGKISEEFLPPEKLPGDMRRRSDERIVRPDPKIPRNLPKDKKKSQVLRHKILFVGARGLPRKNARNNPPPAPPFNSQRSILSNQPPRSPSHSPNHCSSLSHPTNYIIPSNPPPQLVIPTSQSPPHHLTYQAITAIRHPKRTQQHQQQQQQLSHGQIRVVSPPSGRRHFHQPTEIGLVIAATRAAGHDSKRAVICRRGHQEAEIERVDCGKWKAAVGTRGTEDGGQGVLRLCKAGNGDKVCSVCARP